MKSKYIIDVLDPKEVAALGADLSENNEYITETAGFIPLEVKLKQFEQNGYVAQFIDKDFTSTDYREMYLNPDFDITPEDDIEDVFEKLQALREYQNKYREEKAKSDGINEKAGTGEQQEKKADETAKSVENLQE